MKNRIPELILIFYILLPIKSALVAQLILCQIRAIHTARQAEKKFNLDLENDTDDELREFLVSFWFAPSNSTAYAYLRLLAPQLRLFKQPIIEIFRKIASDKFEFTKHAVDQSALNQIQVNEIKEAIANGQLMEEYFIDKHNSSYLISGLTQAQRLIYIKCGCHTREIIKIMAVYELDLE